MAIEIFNNLSLLVTLSVAFILLLRYMDQSRLEVQLLSGLLFGSFVVIGIYNSVELYPGLFFDGRSIILSVAGLFGGPVTAAVAFVMALSYRVWLGGAGLAMGLLVILEATVIGVLFHYLIKKRLWLSSQWMYLIMGFIVHLIMLAMVFFLPENLRADVFMNIVFPVLVFYPFASFVVCMLFHSQRKYLVTITELSESEGRFRQLFDESQMVFLVIDPDSGYILNANKAAEQFYGYSEDEIKQKKIEDINCLSPGQIKENIALAFARKKNHFLFQHRLASGEIRDVEVFAGPVDYAGTTYLYSIVNDVTERIKIENKLRESELSYRGLFNAVKDAIYIQNREGVFLDVNAGAEKMYGYPRESFLGNTPLFLSAPGMNKLEMLEVWLNQAFDGKEPGFEFWGQRSNGEVFPKYVRLFKGMYFGEEVVIAIGHDISQRKQAQKELEDSRMNLNALINVSDDVIVLLDASGNIITHNKTFVNFYGGKSAYQGENLFRILPDDLRGERLKYFENAVETLKPITFEDRNFGKDWWITYYPILDKNMKVDKVAVYARDITDQKKLFNLQKDLQVAEKSAQLKQQFLANMSHEMRTPMNGIIGMSELLSKTELSEVQQDYVATIQESSRSLLSLINDILDLARFESGKMPVHPDNLSIKALERKINNLFLNQAAARGLEFKTIFSPDIPEVIVTDEKRLLQVISNLIGNAIKFTHNGGITLKVENYRHDGNGQHVKFIIQDTGIGIDKDYLDKIFDEFAQLDNSRTRKYEGSGLGLAISKRVVEVLGGEIGVESEKGKGSKFWFTVKCDGIVLTTNFPQNALRSEIQSLGLSVLMVEDKLINRKVAALILKNMGCTVDTAENGLEGVEKVMKTKYDVVLMDIQMPVMDGVTAVKTIRKTHPHKPWIIGLSAEAMKGDAEKYMEMGMDDYLTKPLIPSLLYEKLCKVKKD